MRLQRKGGYAVTNQPFCHRHRHRGYQFTWRLAAILRCDGGCRPVRLYCDLLRTTPDLLPMFYKELNAPTSPTKFFSERVPSASCSSISLEDNGRWVCTHTGVEKNAGPVCEERCMLRVVLLLTPTPTPTAYIYVYKLAPGR